MRKIMVLAATACLALGVSGTASSAFAMGCLTNQMALPGISLSQNAMVPDQGYEYNKDAYDAAMAKGNYCSTTQQAQPVAQVHQLQHHRTLARAAQY